MEGHACCFAARSFFSGVVMAPTPTHLHAHTPPQTHTCTLTLQTVSAVVLKRSNSAYLSIPYRFIRLSTVFVELVRDRQDFEYILLGNPESPPTHTHLVSVGLSSGMRLSIVVLSYTWQRRCQPVQEITLLYNNNILYNIL